MTLLETHQVWILLGFHLFIILMLALDLGVFQRKAHAVSMREAAIWTVVWIVIAMIFAVLIWRCWGWWEPAHPEKGPEKAGYFLIGYFLEKSLSVDNLFVFLVIFRYFAVPPHLQHRVLFWGILGAIVMRAFFIVVGGALLIHFHWLSYVLGGFLVYTGFKLMTSVEEEIDPGRNPLLRLARRFFPVIDSYDQPRFWVKRDGKWHATPLILVLLVVESTDVVFAVDSIPAIFGLWPTGQADRFIAYTSNIFAIIGLRALFFFLAHFLGMFRYLNVGLALVLALIGVKMLTADLIKTQLGIYIPSWAFLCGIAGILTTAIVASLIAGPKEPLKRLPEAVSIVPPEENDGPAEPSSPAPAPSAKDPPAAR